MASNCAGVENQDRISDLPIDAKLHILSFLTVKPAVRTGVLSKRWARIWTLSPVLRLDQRDFAATVDGDDPLPPPSVAAFFNFVDRVLALHGDGSPSITRFELWWEHELDMQRATAAVNHALTHNVREVVVTISPPPPEPEAFTFAHLPSSVSLPELRKLPLEIIIAPTSLLENLILSEDLRCPGDLKASAPKLERLILYWHSEDRSPETEISAPMLARLTCYFHGLLPELFPLSLERGRNTQPLEFATIWCPIQGYGEAIKIARILVYLGNNAKALTLTGGVVEILSTASDLSKHVPSFSTNLRRVELDDALLNDDNIRVIIILLERITDLEKLVIWNRMNKEYRSNMNGMICGEIEDLDHNLHHVKEITINGFLGGNDELELVNFLIKHVSPSSRVIRLNYSRHVMHSMDGEARFKMLRTVSTMSLSPTPIIISTV